MLMPRINVLKNWGPRIEIATFYVFRDLELKFTAVLLEILNQLAEILKYGFHFQIYQCSGLFYN